MMSLCRLILRYARITKTAYKCHNLNTSTLTQLRAFSLTIPKLCEVALEKEEQLSPKEIAKKEANDRTKIIPVETSIKYLKSEAYKTTYGQGFVWEQYRRNHKGSLPPRKTRKTCIRKGQISTGNPCPICRDEYLVLDEHNVDLLKQFISPHTGEVLSYSKTGLCQKRHQQLLVSVQRARDYGFLTFDVPFREYDYSEYYNPAALKQ